jgi:hypothetical protein
MQLEFNQTWCYILQKAIPPIEFHKKIWLNQLVFCQSGGIDFPNRQ